MFNHYRRICLVAPFLMFSCCGCAKLNEGIVDHRYAAPGQRNLLNPYLASSAVARYAIRAEQSVKITLQEAFIYDFYETEVWSETAHGEVAIIVRVRELDGSQSLDYDRSAVESGRVVYYSGDVRKKDASGNRGQYLSFTSLPLYGPITYNGGPIYIELWMVELDAEEAAQVRQILSTLAAVGSAAHAPASPVLKVLDTLGGALLSGEQNDREFRYHCTLWPYRPESPQHESFFLAGSYFIVKQDHARGDRKTAAMEPVDWTNLEFNPGTQRLVLKTSKADYRDHTYITLQVTTGDDPTQLDAEQLFSTFGQLLGRGRKRTADQISAWKDLNTILRTREANRSTQDRARRLISGDYLPEGKQFLEDQVFRTLNEAIPSLEVDQEGPLTSAQVNQILKILNSTGSKYDYSSFNERNRFTAPEPLEPKPPATED